MPTVLHFLKFILLWVEDALPDISNLILVLVGVIMSLPKLAERIEDHSRARYTLALGCMVLGLAGFAVGVHQRRLATSQMTTIFGNVNALVARTNTLVDSTNTTVANTNTLVTTFGLLMPQVNALNARVADLDLKIEAARGKPQLVSDLRAQATAVQAQADSLSKTLALSFAPGVVSELRYWTNKWDSDDRSKSTEYAKQVIAIMTSANYVRVELLRGSDETQEDKRNAAIFAKVVAGESISLDEMKTATRYMENLFGKFIRAPSDLKSAVN
jgi:uncharacterized protein YoxC